MFRCFTALAIFIFVFGCASMAPAADRPNIIFVLADDLGYGDVGCFGGRKIETPNLDALAAEGIRMTQFYSASAVCTPTRVSCLTGRYPLRYGVTKHFSRPNEHLPRPAVTIADLLKQAGYTTAHVGKWHLGGVNRSDVMARAAGGTIPGPLQFGFDHFLTTDEGEIAMLLLKERRFHRDACQHLIRNDKPQKPIDRYWTEYTVDESIRLLEHYHKEKKEPFFLNLWFETPHTPYERPPGPYFDWYQDQAKGDDRLYRAMVSHLDALIGKLVAKVCELGIAENTLILFTSDNGPSFQGSPGPYAGGKADLHEGGIRMPTIVVWPGRIEPGTVSDTLGHTNDLLPTFCAAAGVEVPAELKIDGVNLLPHLVDRKPVADRGTVFWQLDVYEWYPQPGEKPKPYASEVARRGKWKLLAADGKPLELFDLEKDPGEQQNVLDKFPDVASQLARELQVWLSEPRTPYMQF